MADRQTTISFANGNELEVKPSPDDIAAAIEKAEGELIRVLDSEDCAVWINPEHIVSVTSHDIQRHIARQ
ncbi:MAG: hypothetical protein ACRDK5_01510 [Solirubrobacterales bacterium]